MFLKVTHSLRICKLLDSKRLGLTARFLILFEDAVEFTAASKRAQPTRLCHISLMITAPSLLVSGEFTGPEECGYSSERLDGVNMGSSA